LAMSSPDRIWCEHLADNLEQTRAAADSRHLAQLDLEFHEIIVRAAGHSRLLSSWLKLRSQIRLMMMQRNLADLHSQAGTILAHEELLSLLRSQDLARSVALLNGQLESQCEWIMHTFDDRRAEPLTAAAAN
ncbi:MAG TPA: FCD domain-containing protein, partial [Pirellulales bacterium]|nr:FCD domain-containing protein [Pirellulales bacterium]